MIERMGGYIPQRFEIEDYLSIIASNPPYGAERQARAQQLLLQALEHPSVKVLEEQYARRLVLSQDTHIDARWDIIRYSSMLVTDPVQLAIDVLKADQEKDWATYFHSDRAKLRRGAYRTLSNLGPDASTALPYLKEQFEALVRRFKPLYERVEQLSPLIMRTEGDADFELNPDDAQILADYEDLIPEISILARAIGTMTPNDEGVLGVVTELGPALMDPMASNGMKQAVSDVRRIRDVRTSVDDTVELIGGMGKSPHLMFERGAVPLLKRIVNTHRTLLATTTGFSRVRAATQSALKSIGKMRYMRGLV
jgi:hypothetical protein